MDEEILYSVKQNEVMEQNILNTIYNMCHDLPDHLRQWNDIDRVLENLKYAPYTDNDKKVEDFRYINRNFCQYVDRITTEINKRKDSIESVAQLIKEVSERKVQPKSEGWSARWNAYIALRNEWLYNLSVQIKSLMELIKEDNNG